MKAGSLIIIFAFPVCFDPFTGIPLYALITCAFM
jgi:hypothetical protein